LHEKKRDYEAAGAKFNEVKSREKELQKDSDRSALERWIALNNLAPQRRREGGEQLQKALQLFKQGNRNDSRKLAQPLTFNSNLTDVQREELDNLLRLLDTPVPMLPPVPPPLGDYKFCMREGTKFLNCNNLDLAEFYAREALKLPTPFFWPWEKAEHLLNRIQD